MAIDAALDEVMSRMRQGDQDAAALIFRRFVTRLMALASRQLGERLRTKADPEDVVQSVYKSFFVRDGLAPFDLADWDNLWSLLATITVRKCNNRRTYWLSQRRDVGRERVPLDDGGLDQAASATEPTPLQALILTEVLEAVLADLSLDHRRIAELSLQGYTSPEIADQAGCSERTVARVLARLRARLQGIESSIRND